MNELADRLYNEFLARANDYYKRARGPGRAIESEQVKAMIRVMAEEVARVRYAQKRA